MANVALTTSCPPVRATGMVLTAAVSYPVPAITAKGTKAKVPNSAIPVNPVTANDLARPAEANSAGGISGSVALRSRATNPSVAATATITTAGAQTGEVARRSKEPSITMPEATAAMRSVPARSKSRRVEREVLVAARGSRWQERERRRAG
jgi:hypothetical protein